MTLANPRDAEEQVDPRVIDALRAVDREAHDAEYEASTPGAGRWRERIASSRHDRGPTAGEISDADERPVSRSTTRSTQPADDLDGARWLSAVAGMALVLWTVVALALWWLA